MQSRVLNKLFSLRLALGFSLFASCLVRKALKCGKRDDSTSSYCIHSSSTHLCIRPQSHPLLWYFMKKHIQQLLQYLPQLSALYNTRQTATCPAPNPALTDKPQLCRKADPRSLGGTRPPSAHSPSDNSSSSSASLARTSAGRGTVSRSAMPQLNPDCAAVFRLFLRGFHSTRLR